MSAPIVSIIIPTRNRASLLRKTLDSVRQQSFKNFECIVIDDGSDELTRIEYSNLWHNLDHRFILSMPDFPTSTGTGPSAARNRGLELAKGKYIAFCDDDDRWVRPDHISTAFGSLEQENADMLLASMCSTDGEKIICDDWYRDSFELRSGKQITDNPLIYHVSHKNLMKTLQLKSLHLNTCMIRSTILKDAGLFWEKATYLEDMNFIMRVADKAKKILYRAEAVAEFNAMTERDRAQNMDQIEKALLHLNAVQHAKVICQNKHIQHCIRLHEAWQLREIARTLIHEGKRNTALLMFWQSFCLYPSMGLVKDLFIEFNKLYGSKSH